MLETLPFRSSTLYILVSFTPSLSVFSNFDAMQDFNVFLMLLFPSLYKNGLIVAFITVKFCRNNSVTESTGQENASSNEVIT